MTLPPGDEPHAAQAGAELTGDARLEQCTSDDPQGSTDASASTSESLSTESAPSNTAALALVPEEPPLFANVFQPEPPPPVRIPHLGHVVLLAVYLLFSLIVSIVILRVAVHFRLFHVSTLQDTVNDIHYTLGSELILYLVAFAAAYFTFPRIWHKSFFAGLEWNGAAAKRHWLRLAGTGFVCFFVAMILNAFFMQEPTDAPIEKIFKEPGAAWLLFAFGITVAPFFEESLFRGFILPAMCTASDWIAEKINHDSPIGFGASGRPRWPLRANIASAAAVLSLPAALLVALLWRGGQFKAWILVPYSVVFLALILLLAMRKTHLRELARPIDAAGYPLWSIPSIVVGSVFTSVPFAAMHAQQTGDSVDAVLLLGCVSLALCAVRLVTRSLAASVMVHSVYNFLLFSITLLFTHGFQHLDKI
ncbi:MAG TPA: CPBP family intramembrane glutamic endopeptidase [Terracidiphilus sp.]|nr:CPBP family intramembrane glutamic endopeptidase [Terracidiphilus sp.]